MTKKISSVELEKIIAEEIEKSLVDEGILGGLGNVAKGAATGMGQIPGLVKKGVKRVQDLYKKGSEEESDAKRARTQLEKDLVLISTFIDAAERNPTVSKAILDTELGKKLFSPQMQNEAYGSKQLLQMMKKAKIGPQDVKAFFTSIATNQAATKLLNQVKEMTPGFEPQQDVAPQTQQGRMSSGELGAFVQANQPQDPNRPTTVRNTSGQPAPAPAGPPESPRGDDVQQPTLSGEEAKAEIKQKLRTITNPYFRDIFDVFAREIDAMPNIDDKTKKEVNIQLKRLKRANKNKLTQAAKIITDPAIEAIKENKQLERLKELAGILKD